MHRAARVALTGIAAGGVYLAAQAVDLAITGHQTDDRVLVGRLLPIDRSRATTVGTAAHLANSVLFATAFELLARERLQGPMWRRGLTFAVLETLAVYPLAALEDFHPGIRDGHLDTYQTPVAFAQQLWRHAALGIALGAMTPSDDS